jgi:D-amino-acid dehydrogenase
MQNPWMRPRTVDFADPPTCGGPGVAVIGAGIVGAMVALALLRDAPQRDLQCAQAAGVAELVVQRGLLYLYPDRAALEAEALSWRLRRDNGVAWTELAGPALRERLPEVDPRYALGIPVAAGAHCLDPGAYVAALVQ